MSPARRHRIASALALACVIAALFVASAPGASSSIVVTMQVPSAISLTNGCQGDPASTFGTVLPGSGATTATGAGRCTVSWTSTNDTSMLRMFQADGAGTALTRAAAGSATVDYSLFADVDTVDGTSAVAVGNGGTFSFTTDGGSTWNPTYTLGGIGQEIEAVSQAPGDPTKAWAVGYGGRLQLVTSALTAPSASNKFAARVAAGWPAGIDPMVVEATALNTVFVGGADGWVGKSTNSGTGWTVYQLPSTGSVNDLSLAPTGDLWMGTSDFAGGNIRKVVATGGATAGSWTVYPIAPGGVGVFSVAVAGASNGYAVGTTGGLYSWDGTNWTDRSSAAFEYRNVVDVATPTGQPLQATAVGDDAMLLRTVDGGVTWTHLPSPVGTQYQGISAGSGAMIAVGSSQSTVRSTDGGATWSFRSDVPTARGRRGLARAPGNGQLALAVGTRGSIWRTTDGGATWNSPASGTTAALFGVVFASNTEAWAVGESGTVLRSSDAGVTWSTVASGTTRRLNSVAASENTMVAVGDAGTIVRTSNHGSSMTVSTRPGGELLYSVAMHDDDSPILIVGGAATLLRSTDHGVSWNTPGGAPNDFFTAMSMSDATHAIIASSWNTVYLTSDGGLTWSSNSAGSAGGIRAVAAVTPKVMYAADAGALYRTVDGGATWTTDNSIDADLISVTASDANHVILGSKWGGWGVQFGDTTPGIAIPDYGASPNSWAPSAQGMFGVCLQNVGASTTAAAPWVVDGGTCTAADTDPWRAVPTAPSKVATTTLGLTGSVDFVWGVRLAATQAPGTYTAGVTFEALAPAV